MSATIHEDVVRGLRVETVSPCDPEEGEGEMLLVSVKDEGEALLDAKGVQGLVGALLGWLAEKHPATTGLGCIGMIAAERASQIRNGRTPEHDADKNRDGELACAAIHYAAPTGTRVAFVATSQGMTGPNFATSDAWPRGWKLSKRGDRIDRLVMAGALIAAEIDRLTLALPEPRRCGDCGDLVSRCECN